LKPGRYTLDGGVSSQFISGLLFALPLLGGDSELYLTGRVESAPYIALTLDMLEQFGVKADAFEAGYRIPGGQKYRSPGTVRVEGDWSNAAFWLGAGAIGPKGEPLACTGLELSSRQGDRAITGLLRRFGARVEENGSTVTVFGGPLRGTDVDARDIPDLVPILAVVAAAAEGETRIYGAARLRAKESDRLNTVTALLTALGAEARETDDGLFITGGSALTGGEASAGGDHRIAMAAAVAATVCAGPVTLRGGQAVNKSYPGFFADFRALGGTVQEL
jgi:3-phosphoshikimate 1-carboxyvinyltransferase